VKLPSLTLPPLSRVSLALYAGGSSDHIPLHLDSEFARAAGYPDVFMQGMLGGAYVARVVTGWVAPERVRKLSARFVAITYPGETLTASGTVVEQGIDGIPLRCRIELELRNSAGERKLTGHAVVDVPEGVLP
jgi:acyl dehydratase